ncbi:patatin-like phospholipase family protein [Tardiphaga sp. 804_B3_N1_9]|uniref:patatin-like phospholipase family protein n=1 Tax=Tardiphaga TaxID=1395974 RepID=UPI001586C174|nr:patatin-like phospholipase family protein [Tardiphaga robiniae]NUU41841.1 patatin family protein [Tardiphaga robiniae]
MIFPGIFGRRAVFDRIREVCDQRLVRKSRNPNPSRCAASVSRTLSAPDVVRKFALLLPLAAALSGCVASAAFMPSLPDSAHVQHFQGIPHARFLTDAAGRPEWEREARAAWARRTAFLRSHGRVGWTETVLALSGGGQNGAFGAGVLAGWTAKGDRPEFDYVTGVSTGALIAPFAFLGPAYDARLHELFTSIDEDSLIHKRWFGAALTDDSLYDTTPLFAKIKAAVDEEMIARIAREYRNGRLLLIATTNLVAARPVFWNIGAIADSGNPQAPTLIRKILLASAAIPTLFPPVTMELESEDGVVRELHVDGGTTVGQFLYSPTLHLREGPRPQGASNRILAYVIRNGRLHPKPKPVKLNALDIAERAVITLTSSQGLGDLYRDFELARRDRVEVKYTSIGDVFSEDEPDGSLFDRKYMNTLFEYGFKAGLSGSEWISTPPGFDK